ncbi:GTP-binding protein Di-Ras2 [Parasteatoda tepidariorum]|uniref:GTP-binding protein Di-Ras2 n=1 Tax=Parasteatoda tepidariorum TaxID=114398 RepID=UPI00077FC315|nr:GTP-binding protein Di-Ras2-like [Parasteatoda tepidariorum]XP_015919355.1 GTP-binding protein Di-Ras2-like [Parasteatoda tepidariorum]
MAEEYRIRLVVLGGGGSGKSSIIKRFLFNSFCEKHRPTVEDLYCREFDLEAMTLKVDILDTAGDFQFPAMRRLSIATAHAFLLVYSIDSVESFNTVKICFQEIREQKSDFQEVPIVVVGNKLDIGESSRAVPKEDAAEWLFCELPRLRAKILECSAKDNTNIKDIFRAFLQLSKLPLPAEGLKRRSSAHAAAASNSNGATNRLQAEGSTPEEGPASPLKHQRSFKPRSRSLIRRTSKKMQKMKDAAAAAHGTTANIDDCCIS